jgi:hypothetical protein
MDEDVLLTPDFNNPNKLKNPFLTTGTELLATDSTDEPTLFNPFLTLYVAFLALLYKLFLRLFI